MNEPEDYFQKASCAKLIVHAELQLANFYKHNLSLKPKFQFISVSKKSCHMCYLSLAALPEPLTTLACYHKLYTSWILPPTTSPNIYRMFKKLATDLSAKLEATAKQNLETRLGHPRRLLPADSTAGISIS
jgi:hypothetical protein